MCSVIIFQTIFVDRYGMELPPLKTNHFHIDLSITLHMVDANKWNYGNTQVFVVASDCLPAKFTNARASNKNAWAVRRS